MIRILIFGGSGMLGHKLVQKWRTRFEVIATLRSGIAPAGAPGIFDGAEIVWNLDANDADSVERLIRERRPQAVFNAIGIIKQLPNSKDTVETLSVNSIFPHRLAGICAEYGAKLIQISTDCVFSGSRGAYTEEDVPDARDLYGLSKYLGEVTSGGCLTLRTSIIGRELGSAHSLVDWFLGNEGGAVRGFRRAVYSGFPTCVLADLIGDLLEQRPDLGGLYHVSSDPIDKYSLLCLVRDAFGANVAIEPDDAFVIDRSLDSSRFRNETGFTPEAWPAMVRRMAEDAAIYGQKG